MVHKKYKMRYFIKYIKLVSPLMLLLYGQSVFSSAEKIFFNNEMFNFEGPKGTLFYAAKEGVSNIAFSICDKKIKIGIIPQEGLLESSTKFYHNLYAQKDSLTCMISGTALNLPTTTKQTCSAAYLKSEEEMSLSAVNALTMKDTIAICGKDALLTSSLIQTDHFFVTAQGSVTFKAPENASSWLESLTFVASAGTRPFQFMFLGDLNFNPPQTTSFIAIGAQKIILNLKKV